MRKTEPFSIDFPSGLAALEPRLAMMAEGGAIVSYEHEGKCTPDNSLVKQIHEKVPADIRGLFRETTVYAPREGLVLSKDVTLARIAQCIVRARCKLAKGYSVLLLVGSHALPQYAMAALLGISRSELGHEGEGQEESSGRKLSVILAAAMHGTGADTVGVQTTVNDGFVLSADDLIAGRAGALIGDHLYPLADLQRPRNVHGRWSDSLPIADKNEAHAWQVQGSRKAHIPIGRVRPFTLDPRVRIFPLNEQTSNAEDIVSRCMETQRSSAPLKGIVLSSNDSKHPLVSADTEMLQSIDSLQTPTVVLGNKRGEQGMPLDDLRNIIDGLHMHPLQAEVLLSRGIQQSRENGIPSGRERVQFLRTLFRDFPFLDPEKYQGE